jgi:hypothetical protein
MNRGIIYFIILFILILYLIHLYTPIIKEHKRKDKLEKQFNETNNYSDCN